MDNFNNEEYDTVFIQQIDSRSSWQCTPLLLFLYFLVFSSGFFPLP